MSEDRLFGNREAAGAALAAALRRYRDDGPLILGIPRGGVTVAAAVARELGAELDVVIARKLGAPEQPELAMGAVTADGGLYIDRGTVERHGVTEEQLAAVVEREVAEARAREQHFRREQAGPRMAQRTVIVVDDGLATGSTMRVTLHAVRAQEPAWLVVAVPVGPRETPEELRGEADEVICLHTPEPFEAVGFYYDDFTPVSDEAVRHLLTAVSRIAVNDDDPGGLRPRDQRAGEDVLDQWGFHPNRMTPDRPVRRHDERATPDLACRGAANKRDTARSDGKRAGAEPLPGAPPVPAAAGARSQWPQAGGQRSAKRERTTMVDRPGPTVIVEKQGGGQGDRHDRKEERRDDRRDDKEDRREDRRDDKQDRREDRRD